MHFKIYFIFIACIFHCYSKRLNNKQKNIINIVYALDNKYIDYLYTSLITLFENSNKNTIYKIYIQVSSNFTTTNKNLIYSLEKRYFNCIITFIDMKNEYRTAVRGCLDISTYYRLKLPRLIKNINRIIHIDSDSIIIKDLTELFTLNFEQKYILGRLDMITDELDILGIKTKTYINCGVILMDLYSLRKFNYTDKFDEYVTKHNNARYLNHHDQTCINYVCHDKIGIFRPKYHMWPFLGTEEIINFNKKLRTHYDIQEFIEDYYDPFIVHFPGDYKIKPIYFNTTYYMKFLGYKRLAKLIKEEINNNY